MVVIIVVVAIVAVVVVVVVSSWWLSIFHGRCVGGGDSALSPPTAFKRSDVSSCEKYGILARKFRDTLPLQTLHVFLC